MREKQVDCFCAEYEEEKIAWKMVGAAKGEGHLSGSIFIGEKGEITVEKIKDNAFIVCKPCDGDDKWRSWLVKVAEKLRNNGVVNKNIKNEVERILFEAVKKYKDSIRGEDEQEQIVRKKRKFYFGVQYADLLDDN